VGSGIKIAFISGLYNTFLRNNFVVLRMKLILPLLLFSLSSSAQFFVDGTFATSDHLGKGYGGKAIYAINVFKDTKVGAGAEYFSLDKTDFIPLSLNLMYAPKINNSGLSVMNLVSFGYNVGEDGRFHTELYTGIKATNKKVAPYLLIGVVRPTILDRVYDMFSIRTGIAL
jgi:hypothetical protein